MLDNELNPIINENFYSEDVREICLKSLYYISELLERKEIELGEIEEENLYGMIWDFIESYSNGIYKHHM